MSSASKQVENDGPSVSVSEAVLVEGGLTPPPSKVYPGRKCYMVTVSVKGRGEYGGFGPTPGIARRSAIMEACKSLPSNGIDTEVCFDDQVSSSDSETEETSSLQVVKESSMASLSVEKEPAMASLSVEKEPAMASLSVQKESSMASLSVEKESSMASLSVVKKSSMASLSVSLESGSKKSSDDYAINIVHDVAKRKGVELKSEVIEAGQEVVAVVHGGKMSFVGRHHDRRLAQLEAALKMLEALQLLPDRPAPKCPLLALPRNSHPSYNPHPFRRPLPPPPLPHPQPLQSSHQPIPNALPPPPFSQANSNFPPLQSLPLPPRAPCGLPLPPPPHGLLLPPLPCGQPLPPPPHGLPPPLGLPLPPPHADDISSEEGEGDAQRLSRGLCEVVPPKANLSIRPLSPFESYPDPYHFTVPLPRPKPGKSQQTSQQPPWKSIKAREEVKGAGNRKSFRGGHAGGKSGCRTFQKTKLRAVTTTESPATTSKTQTTVTGKAQTLTTNSSVMTSNSLPTHFLLKDVEWEGHVELANSVSDTTIMASCAAPGGLPTEGTL